MFRLAFCGGRRVLQAPPALGYLVSGPLAGPWLFLVLGSTGSLLDSIAYGATVSTLSHASASLEAEKSPEGR
jgi:hypothetical protein